MKEAVLHLGKDFAVKGFSFGYEDRADGEVVFNTAMVGYPESLTDPSYSDPSPTLPTRVRYYV